MVTNLPFLRWLVSHPAVRDGQDDDGVPRRAPSAVAAPSRRPLRPWHGAWRANLPPLHRRRRRTSTSAAHEHGPWRRESVLEAPDARHGDPRARRRGRRGRRRDAAARARGDEDGDAGRLALTTRRSSASTSRRANRSPRATRSSSSRSSSLQRRRRSPTPAALDDGRAAVPTRKFTSQTTIVAPTYVQKPSIEKSRRDPLGEREHRDVDREVREAERDDDQRQREDGEDRLDERVAEREHGRADEQRAPAPDVDAVEQPVDDDQREDVDAPRDQQPDEDEGPHGIRRRTTV